jgi:hypothetical protein
VADLLSDRRRHLAGGRSEVSQTLLARVKQLLRIAVVPYE